MICNTDKHHRLPNLLQQSTSTYYQISDPPSHTSAHMHPLTNWFLHFVHSSTILLIHFLSLSVCLCLPLCVCLSLSHTYTHTHTHTLFCCNMYKHQLWCTKTADPVTMYINSSTQCSSSFKYVAKHAGPKHYKGSTANESKPPGCRTVSETNTLYSPSFDSLGFKSSDKSKTEEMCGLELEQ